MKKTLLSLMIVVVLFLVTACGGGAEQAQPTEAPTEAPAAEQPTEEPAPTEAPEPTATEEEMAEEPPTPVEEEGPELVVWADEIRAPIMENFGQQFADEFGVQITVQQVGFGDIRDQLKVAGPAGEGPDILIGAHDWLGELVINGLLAPIDLGDKEGQFFEPAVTAFTYEGRLYGMPYGAENVAFFRNTDLVPDAPQTWTEVEEISAQLEEAGEVEQGFAFMQADPYHFYPIQSAFGGYVFGRDDEGNYDPTDVGLDSEGSIAAAQWLDMMVEAGHIQPDVDWETAHVLFEEGNAAMMITGPWALPRLREAGIPFAISPLPAADEPGQPFLGVQGFMVSAFSEDPLLAQTFLTEFMATEEAMRALFEADPRPPAFMPVREAVEEEAIAAFAEAGRDGNPMPAIPEMSAVWSAWGDAITLIFQQAEEPEAAFENAAEQVRTAIEAQ